MKSFVSLAPLEVMVAVKVTGKSPVTGCVTLPAAEIAGSLDDHEIVQLSAPVVGRGKVSRNGSVRIPGLVADLQSSFGCRYSLGVGHLRLHRDGEVFGVAGGPDRDGCGQGDVGIADVWPRHYSGGRNHGGVIGSPLNRATVNSCSRQRKVLGHTRSRVARSVVNGQGSLGICDRLHLGHFRLHGDGERLGIADAIDADGRGQRDVGILSERLRYNSNGADYRGIARSP